jgi:hypothetical protein
VKLPVTKSPVGHFLSTLLMWIFLLAAQSFAQTTAPDGVPVKMVITVEARHGSTVPTITRDDVMVFQGHDRRPMIDLIPLKGANAGLQLVLLIDDASSNIGPQLEDIRQFIESQPDSTKVGLAYMHDGVAAFAQDPTNDHAAVAKKLRLPLGNIGVSASPYFSLEDLLKRWPQTNERREVIMMTDGIDRYWGSGPGDGYVDSAIEHAQKEGVLVFGIYAPGEGHFGHSMWRMNWGQNYLSQTADRTGAEAYYLGFGPAVSFKPYFEDIGRKLANQYLATFSAKPEKKAGMQSIKLKTEIPNAELVGADSVFVPASE